MIYYIVVFIALFASEWMYFIFAAKYHVIDKPNDRSSHAHVTLRGGGIIFPIAVLIFFGLSGFTYPWFMLGLMIISVISFWDDLKPLSTKLRLGVHFLAVLLMFYQFGLFFESIRLMPIFLILCVGMINAYNFMDGINGMTGGYSLVVLGTLAWVNHFMIPFVPPEMLGTILVSLLVFNLFNFRRKALCFPGDIGSVSIALMILFVLGLIIQKTQDFSWVCFLTVYGVDSVLTILHRIFLRENITQPHRKHLYQLLANELKIPHVLVSLIYALIQLVIMICYIVCRPLGTWIIWSYIGVVIVLLVCLYIVLKRKWFHLHRSE